MRKSLPVVACLAFFVFDASAFDDPFAPNKHGKPLIDLPEKITSEPGKLTLYADFANAKPLDREALVEDDEAVDAKLAAAEKQWLEKRRVPIYIINRTGKPIDISAESGSFYSFLEYEVAPNQWARAQAHTFSWCGNSYFGGKTLRDGEFLVDWGYLPEKGKTAQVRYRLYNQPATAVSNAAPGFYDADQALRSTHDQLSIIDASFEQVCKVARGETKPKEKVDEYADGRKGSLILLARKFADRKETLPLLTKIKEEGGEFGKEAESALEEIASRAKEKEEEEKEKAKAEKK